ncbi:MAG: glycosyltransferase family 2 protein [Planctomycetota bacterium]
MTDQGTQPGATASTDPSVLVVIVNYRTAGLTADCLDSLTPEVAKHPNTQVTIVDGASGDDSVTDLQHHITQQGYAGWATLLPLEHNGGFAFGNNAAIRPALAGPEDQRPDWVYLLNPDTVLRPGALTAALNHLQAHPDIAILGTRLEHPTGEPQHSAFRFHSVLGEFEHGARTGPITKLLKQRVVAQPIPEAPTECDWLAGASVFIRRDVFDAIGLLDEGYFMYFEEADFFQRARAAGYACYYLPSSRVVHLVGAASGVTSHETRKTKRRPAYWFDSRRRYWLTHHGRFGLYASALAWTLGHAIAKARDGLARRPSPYPPHLVRDLLRSTFFPKRPRLAAGFNPPAQPQPTPAPQPS